MKHNQVQKKATDSTVTAEQLSVSYWRKKYDELKPNFVDLIDMAEKIGEVEPDFYHIRGYFRLQNVDRKKASLQSTAKAVQAIQQVLQKQGLRLA